MTPPSRLDPPLAITGRALFTVNDGPMIGRRFSVVLDRDFVRIAIFDGDRSLPPLESHDPVVIAFVRRIIGPACAA